MNAKLTQKELGQRIAEVRKLKGLSQEDLARRINLSRPSVAQIELGNRNIDIMEMQRFAMVLGFSMDEFISKDFVIKDEMVEEIHSGTKKDEMRISVPTLKVSKFRNVLLYILERCAGKPNIGETMLYKLLYFADFNYYELYEEHLTGARYYKLPYGPVPRKLDAIINDMIEKNQLQRIKTEYHGYQQTRYIPLEKAELTELKASEKEVIDRVIEQFSDWTAAAISAYSHKDMPWLASQEGEAIDYELAFYRIAPYAVRFYDEDEHTFETNGVQEIKNSVLQKAIKIREAVEGYFKASKAKRIPAKDLMNLFIEKNIFNANYNNGLPIRSFLRVLNKSNYLHLIPHAYFEKKKKNVNWYFLRSNLVTF